jgi:hypothetical protein
MCASTTTCRPPTAVSVPGLCARRGEGRGGGGRALAGGEEDNLAVKYRVGLMGDYEWKLR